MSGLRATSMDRRISCRIRCARTTVMSWHSWVSSGSPKDRFHSLVVFSGDCELKTPMPSNVLVGDYENRVRGTGGIRLTDTEVLRVCEALRALESASTEAARDEHVARLRERFSSTTTCPQCGAPLVERRSTKLTGDGEPFLGCRAFPRCTNTRKIKAAYAHRVWKF